MESRREKLRNLLKKTFNKLLVLPNFIGLTFIVLSFLVIAPLTQTSSDLMRVLIGIYGIVVIVLTLALIAEFAWKTVQLQALPEIRRYSSLVSLNAVFGLIAPLIYLDLLSGTMVRLLNTFPKYNNILCDLRLCLIKFYQQNYVHWQLQNLILACTIMVIALFLFGGLIERHFSKGKN